MPSVKHLCQHISEKKMSVSYRITAAEYNASFNTYMNSLRKQPKKGKKPLLAQPDVFALRSVQNEPN